MKTINKYFLFLIAMFVISTNVFSQQFRADPDIIIGSGRGKFLYSDQSNLIVVESKKDSIQTLIIKTSQGNLQNFDSGMVNGLFSIYGLKNGKVMISVFRKSAGGLTLLNYKEFNVVTRPLTADEKRVLALKIKPVITLNGYNGGTVRLDSIRSATRFEINKPYKIRDLVIYFGSYTGICGQPLVSGLKSGDFDEEFKKIWRRLQKNNYVDLVQIIVEDNKGNVYNLSPVYFGIAKE